MSPALDHIRRMALNNAWANATVYGALQGLSDADFAAPRPGFFGSLKETLNHIHQVDLYYINALESGGLGRSVYDVADQSSVNTLAQYQADADARLTAFCHALDDADLPLIRQTERKDCMAPERVDALLLHLFQHQIHHRGQAHTQILDAGIAPPQLDDFHLEFGRVPSAQAYFQT